MADEVARIVESDNFLRIFRQFTEDITTNTKEADNPIDNIMCQDILINVIFDCEFGGSDLGCIENGIPCQAHCNDKWQCARNVSIKHNVPFNMC